MPRRASIRSSAFFACSAARRRRPPALAEHRRNVPDRPRGLGAAQHQIVFAMAQQCFVGVGDRSEQIGARAPQPPDIIGRQHQVGRPLRLEEGLDRARGRIAATLVAVEKIRVGMHRRGDRHFEKSVDAQFVPRRQHGEKHRVVRGTGARDDAGKGPGVRLRSISSDRATPPCRPAGDRG